MFENHFPPLCVLNPKDHIQDNLYIQKFILCLRMLANFSSIAKKFRIPRGKDRMRIVGKFLAIRRIFSRVTWLMRMGHRSALKKVGIRNFYNPSDETASFMGQTNKPEDRELYGSLPVPG